LPEFLSIHTNLHNQLTFVLYLAYIKLKHNLILKEVNLLATYFNLILDTTPPSITSLVLNDGNPTNNPVITANITATDAYSTISKMLIWGNVDTSDVRNAGIGTDEASATWIDYSAAKTIVLSTGDGSKSISIKLQDAVLNADTTATSASIILDTTAPIPEILSGPTPDIISEISTADTAEFSYQSNEAYTEYTINVVPASTSDHTTGAVIGGKTGTGTFPANTAVNDTIIGSDLKAACTAAGLTGDGSKYVKVFVKDAAGNWSV
jgi:hypothetical protein